MWPSLLCIPAFHSYFLYSISHLEKNGFPSIDLSDDSEAQVVSVESTMTDFQIAVDCVFLFPNCIIHKFLHCDFIGSVYHVTL